MPGTRCKASAADLSGKAPMSVAVIESTKVSAFFLMFCDVASACRTPVTITSCVVSSVAALPDAGAVVEDCCVCAAVSATPLSCA